ncbi:uncharacterized protein MELLADRAFT_84259 [Melampsora larici-populina 98AG31]|uniref:Uncharacterized protein n=1 Tax=Melampsora larici-populina (strain 98AG31 / pathotype 3-4-7) TaxID=747676 RepID=F4RF30_MELLP|nr:uncharacterized protein MELLADRAFT_84259 [Melampsora larici-populina 98AG31]EGG08743.1 hypothetical protein MELLADRAFT_84259 [Melampsora larici-populina 98AG31]
MERLEHEYYWGDHQRADKMLRAFNAVYGGANPTQQERDNITNNAVNIVGGKRARSPDGQENIQDVVQRPRTESLIPGGESESDGEQAPAQEKKKDPEAKKVVTKRKKAIEQMDLSSDKDSGSSGDDDNETEEGITYMIGKPIEGSILLPLTPYFENRMKNLKAYVQLTVFDPAWIESDHRQVGKKKTKSLKELQEDDSTATYSGLTPPEELLMTYGAWTDAIDLFIKYVETEYNRPAAAKMFRRHRDNVRKIRSSTKCWMVALRYCMKVRLVVMVVKKKDGKRVMIDAGHLHEEILREAKDDADNNGERKFLENPYVAGGGKESIDPVTGLTKSSAKRNFASNNGGSTSHANKETGLPTNVVMYTGSSSANLSEPWGKPAGAGYQGRNFIENFSSFKKANGTWNPGKKTDANQVFGADGNGKGKVQYKGRGGGNAGTGNSSTGNHTEAEKHCDPT